MSNIEVSSRRKPLVLAHAVYRNDKMYASKTEYIIPRGTILTREAVTNALKPFTPATTEPPVAILTNDYVQVDAIAPVRVLVGGIINIEALPDAVTGTDNQKATLVTLLKQHAIYAAPELARELDN